MLPKNPITCSPVSDFLPRGEDSHVHGAACYLSHHALKKSLHQFHHTLQTDTQTASVSNEKPLNTSKQSHTGLCFQWKGKETSQMPELILITQFILGENFVQAQRSHPRQMHFSGNVSEGMLYRLKAYSFPLRRNRALYKIYLVLIIKSTK